MQRRSTSLNQSKVATAPRFAGSLAGRAGQARRRNRNARRPIGAIRAQRLSAKRRGGILVLALICLVLAAALIGTVLRQVQLQRRQIAQHDRRLQAEWLAESGLERAAARLRADPAYAGETWSVPASELGGTDAGEVIVHVGAAPQTDSRNIHVEAEFPAQSTERVRRTKQATLVLFEES
jgi:Tfp pilus assembly protein PilX